MSNSVEIGALETAAAKRLGATGVVTRTTCVRLLEPHAGRCRERQTIGLSLGLGLDLGRLDDLGGLVDRFSSAVEGQLHVLPTQAVEGIPATVRAAPHDPTLVGHRELPLGDRPVSALMALDRQRHVDHVTLRGQHRSVATVVGRPLADDPRRHLLGGLFLHQHDEGVVDHIRVWPCGCDLEEGLVDLLILELGTLENVVDDRLYIFGRRRVLLGEPLTTKPERELAELYPGGLERFLTPRLDRFRVEALVKPDKVEHDVTSLPRLGAMLCENIGSRSSRPLYKVLLSNEVARCRFIPSSPI